jgi:hypothetical protein
VAAASSLADMKPTENKPTRRVQFCCQTDSRADCLLGFLWGCLRQRVILGGTSCRRLGRFEGELFFIEIKDTRLTAPDCRNLRMHSTHLWRLRGATSGVLASRSLPPNVILLVEVRRARFGPGLWPGPRRQARWAGRGSGAQGSALAEQATRRRRALDAGGASPDNARRSGPLAVTSSRLPARSARC